jgi:hypothetical protein
MDALADLSMEQHMTSRPPTPTSLSNAPAAAPPKPGPKPGPKPVPGNKPKLALASAEVKWRDAVSKKIDTLNSHFTADKTSDKTAMLYQQYFALRRMLDAEHPTRVTALKFGKVVTRWSAVVKSAGFTTTAGFG